MGAVRLTAPSGAAVTVDSNRVDNLVRLGFQRVEEKKAPAKKATSGKSSGKK